MSSRKFKEFEKQMSELSREGDLNRGRSISVGSAGGGVCELSVRTHDGRSIWYVMQPVEVTELIHQLAANIGCHIHLQPRKDFGSWRQWNQEPNESPNFPPMAIPYTQENLKLPEPEMQPGLQPNTMDRSKDNDPAMAINKPVKRRKIK